MNYLELVDNFEKSDNPLVRKMIKNSQEVVDKYKKLLKGRLTEKERIDYILRHSIIEINYKHSNGESSTYRCSSNPYFVALLSAKKFSEYQKISQLINKEMNCHRPGHFATWDLVRNRRVEFVTMRTKWNPLNAIEISINEDSKELINETFKKLSKNKKENKDDKKDDMKELFKL